MAKVNPNTAKSVPAKAAKPAKEKKPQRPGFEVKELLEVGVPEGFNFKDFKPLKKKAFKTLAAFYDHAAAYFEFKAQQAKEKAEQERKYGDKGQRTNVKRLEAGIEKMADLIKTLKAGGMDTTAFESKMAELLAAANAEEGATE